MPASPRKSKSMANTVRTTNISPQATLNTLPQRNDNSATLQNATSSTFSAPQKINTSQPNTITSYNKLKIGILTSGGDAPGINSAIEAILRACRRKHETFFIMNGYQGMVDGEIQRASISQVNGICSFGGTMIG